MPNFTSTLSGTITGVDANSKQPITRDLGSPALAGAVGELASYVNLAVAGADVPLTLPAANVYCIYIKNLNAGGGGCLVIKGTPSGGIEVTLARIPPGSIFILWCPVNSVANTGYSGIKLNPDANNTPVEYFLGA